MDEPICELHRDDNDDIFVLVDGVKIAKRGPPNTAQANTWIMLEPGWIVRDVKHGNTIEVRFEGATIH
jgi:archaellum component FlaG (FlaF/FlaG flagellin family)